MMAIADTGWIVALKSDTDQHRDWAVRISRDVQLPVLTCEAVLAEACYRLKNTSAVMELVARGCLKIDFRLDEQLDRINQLAASYHNRKPDLADLCVIRMSEMFRQRTVLTVDARDFKVYRRNRDEAIPFLAPE